MSEETATLEFSAETKEMGDKIAELTLKQAKELSDYLKEEHGSEPAAGGAVMAAMPAGGAGGEAGRWRSRATPHATPLALCRSAATASTRGRGRTSASGQAAAMPRRGSRSWTPTTASTRGSTLLPSLSYPRSTLAIS